VLFSIIFAVCHAAKNENVEEMAQREEKVDDTKLEYAKGSLCKYCDYCKV